MILRRVFCDQIAACTSYSALVTLDEDWVDEGTLRRLLDARGYKPMGLVKLWENSSQSPENPSSSREHSGIPQLGVEYSRFEDTMPKAAR